MRITLLSLLPFVASGLMAYGLVTIPLPRDIQPAPGAHVYDRRGKLIGTFSGETRRFLIDAAELPEHVGEAIVAAEDRGFYSHFGISFAGIVRAAWRDVTAGEIRQGGSTISQQYVKNALLADPQRTLSRKLKEAVLAIKLERRFSKNEILGFYLNTAYWGRGAYGIEAAARTYFDKGAKRLTIAEAAFLAAILPAPERFQPDLVPRVVRTRRDLVVDAMAGEGFITTSEAAAAKTGPVAYAPGLSRRADRRRAGYYLDWLSKEYLEPRFGQCLYTCGLEVHTTLDLDMQRHAEDAVAGKVPAGGPEASLVAVTPGGEVRAFVGGRRIGSYKASRGFNFASDVPGRHAGSAFKPFALLAALENGVSPSRAFSGSSPATISVPSCATGDKPWKLANYGGSSYGTVSLEHAMALSINTVYARLTAEVGPKAVARIARRLGFDRRGTEAKRPVPAHCSLALGALDVTTVEMARSYGALAGRGVLPTLRPVSYVTDRDGNCLVAYGSPHDCEEAVPTPRRRVAAAESVDLVTRALARVVTSGTGAAARLHRPVAGKTGTSQHNTDAWFAGYVPQLATAVWVGHPAEKDGKGRVLVPQMRACPQRRLCRPVAGRDVTGSALPTAIWRAFMARATSRMKVADFPLVTASSAGSGGATTPGAIQPSAESPSAKAKKEPAAPPPDPPEPDPPSGGPPLPLPLPPPTRAPP